MAYHIRAVGEKSIFELQKWIFKFFSGVEIMQVWGLGDSLRPGTHPETDLESLEALWSDS